MSRSEGWLHGLFARNAGCVVLTAASHGALGDPLLSQVPAQLSVLSRCVRIPSMLPVVSDSLLLAAEATSCE